MNPPRIHDGTGNVNPSRVSSTGPDETRSVVIVCEPRADCVDQNVNRWYCMRGHDGAPADVCPLPECERQGANREAAERKAAANDPPAE